MFSSRASIHSYRAAALLAACVLGADTTANAQLNKQDPLRPMSANLVQAELIADVASVAPGTPFRLGVRLKMTEGWHVNWINPGDAGLAPSIGWTLPDGFKAGILQWPLPGRFAAGPLTIFGYDREVLLMTDVRPPAQLPPGGNIELGADVSWLACAEECIPGSATLSLRLPVEATARKNDDHVKLFDDTEARLPHHAVAWRIDARFDTPTTLVLDVQNGSGGDAPLEGLFFFPYEPGLIENSDAQTVSMQPGPGGAVYEMRITRARIPSGRMSKVHGVLVAASGMTTRPGPAAIEIDVPVIQR
jgi:thiol:disulfide interchange protein DsbD